MAKTKVKVIVALFAVIALSLLAVCFGRLFSPAEAKAADGTYDDTAAVALMTALATNNEVTLTQDVVFDLTVPSGITGSGTMKENGRMDIVGNKTIDLAGFTLKIITGSENCCVEVTSNASLTIKDSSAAGTGKVVGQSAGDFAWGQTGTSISLTNVDVEFTSTETGAAGDEGTTPGGSSEDHVILSNGSVELSGVTFDTNVSDPVAVFTKNAETGEFVGSDVTYGTLQDAINADETSITLDKDYTESITVSKGQNVTIDLNGFTLTNVANEHTVTNYGTLTVKDGSEEKTGTVDNVSNGCGSLVNYGVASVNSGNIVRGETAQGSWYVIKNYGYMTLGTNAQSAVKVDTNSDNSSLIANGYFDGTDKEANESSITVTEKARTLVINGGTYTNGMNAVKNDDEGVLTINNGSFTNNYTEPGYNGAVILTAGTMNINGGKFTQINGSSHGIRITTSGDDVKVNIGGGEFSEYAGVYLMHERNSTGGKLDVTISGGTFDGKIETDNVIGTAVSGTDTIAITGGTFNNDLSLGVEMDVAISGGDYKYIPNNDYLADEVKMYQYTEGAGAKNDLFVIVAPGEEQPENTVATGYVQAGKKGYYNTLAEALAAGESSVYLRADITESVTYTGGYLTIYLEGHTWTADGDQPALTNNNASSILNIRSTKGYDGGAIVRTTPGPVIVNNNSLSFSTSSSGKYTVKNESNGDYALIENNGTISITSGSFDSASALFDNKTAGSKITIMSTANGTFTAGTNIVKNNLGTVKISAGTFNKTVDKEYIAAGYTSVNNGDGTFGVVKVVAQIVRGEETFDYTDFATAVAALQDNDTLIILASVSGGLTIDDGLTVTLEVYGTLSGGIINNGTLTIRGDGTVEGTVTNNNNASLKIESGEFESLFVANGKDISITGGTFKGGANEHDGDSYLRSIAEYLAEGYYFVSHSGTTGNMYTVGQCDTYAATVTDGDFTLNVGTLEVAAMYVRYSAATSDVTITLNDDVTPAKSIAFYQGGDSEAKNVTLDLNGHSVTFDSGKGFTVGGSSESQSHNITIEGSGKVDGTMTVKYGTLKIKGGTYTANVESYLAEGYVQQEDGSVILEAAVGAVAQIGDMYYKDLKTAIEAAAENATITLLADVTESVTIAADDVITLNLNGKTITNTAGQHTITNNGTLTIVGNGTVNNVSHGRAALLNNPNATMTVLGGTYRRTAENAGNNSFYVIQNKGTMTIGGTGASDIVVYAGATTEGSLALRKSSLVTSGWYSDAPDGGAASLTINSGSFYGGNIAIKCDEKTSLTINGGVFNAYNQAVQSWTNTKITNGTFNGIVAAWTLVDNTTGDMIETPSALDITGGTFNGAIVANRYVYLPDDEYATEVNDNADVDISGGTFTKAFDSDFLADNVNLYQTETGFAAATEQNAPENATKVVAFVSDKAYGSIQEAINAADGAPVTLYDDVTLSEALTIDKAVTINLNGKTVSASTTAANITANATIKNGTIDYVGETSVNGLVVTNNATLTLEGVTVDYEGSGQAVRLGKGGTPENNGGNAVITDSEIKGGVAGVAMFGTAEGAANKTILTATDSTITGSVYYGIATNGIFYNNDITLSGTTVKGTSTGMYLPGSGETTITGGSVEGATGIEIRAGKLTINEGTIVKADGDYAVEPNGNGSTVVGVAIAVSQHTTERPIEVTVNGGEFSATGTDGKAFYETDTVTGETEPSEDVTITIDGGNFKAPVESENKTGFVEGGNFTEVLAPEYVSDTADLYVTANGYAVYDEGDTPAEGDTKVIAMVGDKAYDKLADAVAAATDDGAVTLYVDVKENITVASGTVTIDLAGNTLNGFIKSTGATVNVKNGTVSGSWIDGAVMANGEGASVTLTDTVIGNPISISNDGAVTLVRSTTRGRITVGSGSAPENYTAGTLTITDSIIEKEISVEMLGKVVISDTVEYKTSFASGVKVTAKDPAALEAFKGYGVTTVVHVANEEQLLKALELGVSEIEVQSMELSAPVEITKDVKIYGGNKGDHEIVGSFIVKGEIEVTIEDVSFAGDGTGAALTVTDGAKLTYSDNLSNVTVAVSGFEAGISVDGNSSATVNNITFENISAAAEVKDGKSDAVTFNGCTIPEDTAQYVAVVTDATNLASAIADSKFAKVTLGADVELTSALVIERSVTLDLNGYDITGNINVTAADVTITAPETSDSAINGIVTVTNADDFTLSNVTVNYTVTGEEEADSLKIMGAVVIDGSENATIDNVTVNVTANNSGLNVVSVWVKNDSTATISDSTIDLEFRATEENRTQGQVVRAETSDLTIKDSVITTTDYGVIFYGDMSATDAQADNTAAFDKLVIENSTVTVTDTDEIVGAYAVSGNGSNRNGTIIEITGSTITSDVATAIYHPQYGNMTITDSVITGASGIEMRSGNLTVTSGTITATGAFEVEPNGNGNTASGVAVAVSQHTTEMKINVQLNGGTFNATGENGKAFYETDTVTGVDPSADVTVDLNGGTYEAAVEAKNIKNFINDGLYKEEPKEDAFAEGYEGVLYNGYYQVVEATTDDPAALLTAKTEAQADVRSYLLNACGMTIADVKALAADETLGAAAQAVIDAYAAMDGATSESKLAIARLSVMDAIDALDKALDTALADYKADAIDEINSYGAEKDVAVPTATIMAINSAKTEAEVDMYKEYAIGEIDDIVAYREAISNIKIPNYSDTLDDLSAKLDTLTGNLTSVSNTLGEKIDAVKTDIATVTADIDKLETTLAGLADSDDVNGIAEDISDIIEQLAAIKSTVDGISVAVDEATAVEEVKTEAAAEIDAWLEDYIDSIVESSATSVRDILTAKAAMADDLRSKLVDAFGEDNAALIEKYYDDAMAAIENATSASEATNAVSTFKAQVASVEAAAGNTTSLAGVYVLLAIILVVAIVAVVLAVVLKRKGGEPAPAAAQPAPEAAPAPAPAAETAPAPAATEEAPAAQPEDESAATATDEDTERVVITASTRTFEEAYEALDPELRDLFDKVKAYALSKNGTTEVKLSNCICIKYGSKKVVRLTVRRSYPLAMFVIENEMVKDFRRNATGALKLKVPATELVIRDEEDLKAAYSMVDLAVDQILKDIEAAKERRRAARRARRAQREAEAGEAGETPEAPEAPDDGGKK